MRRVLPCEQLPVRSSSIRFITTPPTTPRKKSSQPAIDTCPFPLTPQPLTPSSSPASKRASGHRTSGKGGPYQTSPTSPDRFIPARRSKDTLAKVYRLSKNPSQLSPTERILRHRSASRDPFERRRPHRVLSASRPSGPPQITRPIRQGTLGILPTPRAASTGAIWNVGGTFPPLTPTAPVAVSNGRGGVFGSGTNAPMFNSDFLSPDTERQNSERFEARIAAALDIDQSRRLMNFSPPPSIPVMSSRGVRIMQHSVAGRIWKDNQWVPTSQNPSCKWPRL
jgi:hypothetical protein